MRDIIIIEHLVQDIIIIEHLVRDIIIIAHLLRDIILIIVNIATLGGSDKKVLVWDISEDHRGAHTQRAGSVVLTCQGHTHWVRCCVELSSGAIASGMYTIKLVRSVNADDVRVCCFENSNNWRSVMILQVLVIKKS